jgi:hypothetical protein
MDRRKLLSYVAGAVTALIARWGQNPIHKCEPPKIIQQYSTGFQPVQPIKDNRE